MYRGPIFKTVENPACFTDITRKFWLINISENLILSIYWMISVVIAVPLWEDTISSLDIALAESAGSLRAAVIV